MWASPVPKSVQSSKRDVGICYYPPQGRRLCHGGGSRILSTERVLQRLQKLERNTVVACLAGLGKARHLGGTRVRKHHSRWFGQW